MHIEYREEQLKRNVENLNKQLDFLNEENSRLNILISTQKKDLGY